MKVKVCDAIMGAGKTSAAINMMNQNPEKRYLFITPYLDEITRIRNACPELCFCEPVAVPGRTKRQHLEELLAKGYNIASTHALFSYYRTETLEAIRAGGYTLILDEVMNVIEPETIQGKDVRALFDKGFMEMAEDGMHVRWLMDDYDGAVFQDLMRKAQLGNLIYFENSLLFWSLPVACFEAFEDVVILTYMFQAQVQSYYYQLNGVEIEYIGTRKSVNGYEFSVEPETPEYTKELIRKVHILEDSKLNSIGQSNNKKYKPSSALTDSTLCSHWFAVHAPLSADEKKAKMRAAAADGKAVKKASARKDVDLLARNVINVFKNRWKCPMSDTIWTVFKAHEQYISKRGYKRSFVSCNVRATNAYKDRHYLAYCINVYYDVRLTRYFRCFGIEVDQNGYALSEMVQWIWRSAIRCGEDIWIYVPSIRMRTLLKNWLKELAS